MIVMIGEWIQQADVWILLLIQEYLRADWMTGFWKAVTFLGNAGWFWIVTAVVFALIPKTRRAGLTAGFSLAVGALITNVFLKNAVARIRPYDLYPVIELLVEKQTDFSFPSGHTSASFAAALVYLRMFPERKGWGFVILAVLIGFSRLYVGVHYPTDAGRFFCRVACRYPGFEGRGSMGKAQESRERKGVRCEWLKKAERHRKIEF